MKKTKYEPLSEFLSAQSTDKVVLSFERISEIISAKLPKSAYTYEAWWSNSQSDGRQNNSWLKQGWETTELNLKAKTVKFRRKK